MRGKGNFMHLGQHRLEADATRIIAQPIEETS
jgi:hypothetical protein